MPQSACISPQADGGIRTHDPRFTRVSRTGKRRGFEAFAGRKCLQFDRFRYGRTRPGRPAISALMYAFCTRDFHT